MEFVKILIKMIFIGAPTLTAEYFTHSELLTVIIFISCGSLWVIFESHPMSKPQSVSANEPVRESQLIVQSSQEKP
jgi:hypothetical protein